MYTDNPQRITPPAPKDKEKTERHNTDAPPEQPGGESREQDTVPAGMQPATSDDLQAAFQRLITSRFK